MLNGESTASTGQPRLRKPLATAIAAASLSLASSLSVQAAEPGQLKTVVVRGQHVDEKLASDKALNPGASTIIDGDELYRRGVANLADTLRYAPGIFAESASGGDAIFFSSRGSNLDATDYDENGIKLLQDGLPVTTADGNNHNRFIDPLSARYIVFAPGANALTFGASTLGGAINFISPTARDSAPLELFVSGGSNGLANARATAGTVDGQFDGLISLEKKHWDGYRDHSQTDREGVYANTGWQFSDAVENRAFFTYVNNEQQLPASLTKAQVHNDPDQAGAAALSANRAKDLESWRVADKTTWRIDERSSLEFGVSYEQQALYHPIVGPVIIGGEEKFSLVIDTDHHEAGATLRYNLQFDEHDLLVGIDYGHGHVNGGNYRNNDGRRNGLTEKVDNNADTVEAYAMDRWTLGNWTWIYGAQAVSASRDAETTTVDSGGIVDPHGTYSSINPRAGVIYAFSDNNQLFANISRLYEPPTNFELADDSALAAVNTPLGTNDPLDAMHGTVVEFGARGQQQINKDDRWHWDATIYYAQIRNEILSVDDKDAPGNSLSTNIDKTTHAGIETLIGASFVLDTAGTHHIEPLVSATYNDFHFDSDKDYGDNDLPAAPGFVVRGEILYRNANGFYVGPTFDIVDERHADFSNNSKIDGYELIGLRSGYDATEWEVFAEVKNLTDKEYVSTIAVLEHANVNSPNLYPGAPRSVFVGATFKF